MAVHTSNTDDRLFSQLLPQSMPFSDLINSGSATLQIIKKYDMLREFVLSKWVIFTVRFFRKKNLFYLKPPLHGRPSKFVHGDLLQYSSCLSKLIAKGQTASNNYCESRDLSDCRSQDTCIMSERINVQPTLELESYKLQLNIDWYH